MYNQAEVTPVGYEIHVGDKEITPDCFLVDIQGNFPIERLGAEFFCRIFICSRASMGHLLCARDWKDNCEKDNIFHYRAHILERETDDKQINMHKNKRVP